jgi:colanic acid/amylovoran biosynthesis glycosyltransferase
MQVAYLVGRYPSVTHTFILREVRTLERLGADVHRFSIWRTDEQGLLTAVDREEWAKTEALLAMTPARVLGAHLRALARAPAGYLRTLGRALALSSSGLRRRALALSWFVEAMLLWDACRKRGVRHVHVHLDGTGPMVALLAVEFANAGEDGGGTWSWSQTVHGSKEFYDIHRERLDVKAAGATFLACISDYTRSQVMAFVPEELWPKLIVVRCGVDLEQFAPRGQREHGDLRILTVGRVDSMKGTVVLLQAVQRLAERGLRPTLTVVGDGPSKAKAIEMARRLGISDQVSWEGAVGQDRIRDYYAGCDVFCLPSFAEGIPIVLMEAMAMEVPVVANAITGIVELVDNGVSGLLVRPGRVDELTEQLAKLLENPALRRSMGRAGRARVQAEYDLEHNVRRLASVFADGPLTADKPERPNAPVPTAPGHAS